MANYVERDISGHVMRWKNEEKSFILFLNRKIICSMHTNRTLSNNYWDQIRKHKQIFVVLCRRPISLFYFGIYIYNYSNSIKKKKKNCYTPKIFHDFSFLRGGRGNVTHGRVNRPPTPLVKPRYQHRAWK